LKSALSSTERTRKTPNATSYSVGPKSEDKDVSKSGDDDELPQKGLARSLLQQWRALEVTETASGEADVVLRGRATGRSTLDARRTQSMSRAEATQRAREYRGEPTVRSVMVSREVELDCNTVPQGEVDEMPPPDLLKNRLAWFREMQAESASNTQYQFKPARKVCVLNRLFS